MRYEEIIGLHEYFQPVYDIIQEPKNYWKQFIPTKSFLEILEKFLNSLEATNPKDRKSIWIQGTYGTGKSHATGVIKHLLWDDPSEIDDYLRNIEKVQLRERLKNFRKENRVLPVTLKGISGIYSPKEFSLIIEIAVKESLKKYNISVIAESEFDKYLKYIDDPKINWQDVIEGNPHLKSLVGDINGLKNKLHQNDPEIIKLIEEALGDLKIVHPNIEDWLSEILKNLSDQGIKYMTIYWDEFTPLLELSQSPALLNILQNIAEKSFNENIFLFIISHRHPQQTQIEKEDQEKVLGRFLSINYFMENITTFHIVSKTIDKKREEDWKKIRDNIYNTYPGLNKVLNKLVPDNTETAKVLKDLFPIHPYTAQLAVGISRYIGSTERSIFSFLYDEEKGFINFIKNYPDKNNVYLLTADKLWDYFIDDLKRRQDDKIGNILSKYYSYHDSLKNKGEEYLTIFKGILILNLLQSIITLTDESSLFIPKRENIEDMFLGTHYRDHIDQVLDYIDKNIIPKTPDGLYRIFQTPLPEEELSREKESARREFEDITKLINDDTKNSLLDTIKNNLLREPNLNIYWAGLSENEILRKIDRDYRNSYEINIALFLPKINEEISIIKKNIRKIINGNPKARNIVFVVSNREFGEQDYERLLEYIARKKVAYKHSFNEEAQNNEKYIDKLINIWIEKVEKDFVNILFRDKEEKITFSSIADKINKDYSKEIFTSGLENIEGLTKNRNLWTFRNSIKYAKTFLTVENRKQLEDELKTALDKPILEILKSKSGEYIVNSNFEFYNNIDPDHPTFKIFKEVENRIKEHAGKTFNLGELLEFLKEPPYGIYPNIIHYALLGFVLRPHTNKLYETGTGKKVNPTVMEDKIKDIFEYFTKGKEKEKLEVRLGTQNELELTEILKDIFGLKEAENLNKAKWEIRNWIKEVNLPIWSLKYLPQQNEGVTIAIKTIEYLSKSIDKELSEENVIKYLQLFKNVKTDLKLILKKEKVKEGFKNWLLTQQKEVKINEEEIEEVIDYLYKHMQEEVALWDEKNVLLKLKDWAKEKDKERYKIEFINNLCNIFNLQKRDNIQELREDIKNYINNNLRYPLWSIKYVLKLDEINHIINFLEEFIRSNKDPSQEDIINFSNLLPTCEKILYLNLNPETAEKGIQELLKTNSKKLLDNNEINDFLDFTRENLKKDIYLWEEKDLKNSLTLYEFLKLIAELFNIDKNYIKIPDDLKIKIKNQVTNKIYPFWAVGLIDDNEVKKTTEELSYYITSDKNYSLTDIESLYQMLENNKEKIKSIWESTQIEKLYKEWLREILKTTEDVSKIVSEIKAKIRNEDYYWKKTVVENLILKEKENLIRILNKEKKEKIAQKIKNTNRDLREILVKLIDKYPQIISDLEELL